MNNIAINPPLKLVINCIPLIMLTNGKKLLEKDTIKKLIILKKPNLAILAKITASQYFFLLKILKTKTKIIFDTIINGMIGAKIEGKMPTLKAIKLGNKLIKTALFTPNRKTATKRIKLTIVPVTNCCPNNGAITAIPNKTTNRAVATVILLSNIKIFALLMLKFFNVNQAEVFYIYPFRAF